MGDGEKYNIDIDTAKRMWLDTNNCSVCAFHNNNKCSINVDCTQATYIAGCTIIEHQDNELDDAFEQLRSFEEMEGDDDEQILFADGSTQ